MTVDQRLLNLIEAARKLDGDNVTLEQMESCRQYSQIIACSLPELPYDFENCRPGDYADATEAAIHRLAIAMYQHADALFRIKKFKGDQWATEMHKRAREEFRTARIEAEMLATGHVSAATLIATAESAAPTPTDDVTLDDDEVVFVNSSSAAQQCQMSPGDWEFQVAPLTTQNRPF
jgi:hypothetical protein